MIANGRIRKALHETNHHEHQWLYHVTLKYFGNPLYGNETGSCNPLHAKNIETISPANAISTVGVGQRSPTKVVSVAMPWLN